MSSVRSVEAIQAELTTRKTRQENIFKELGHFQNRSIAFQQQLNKLQSNSIFQTFNIFYARIVSRIQTATAHQEKYLADSQANHLTNLQLERELNALYLSATQGTQNLIISDVSLIDSRFKQLTKDNQSVKQIAINLNNAAQENHLVILQHNKELHALVESHQLAKSKIENVQHVLAQTARILDELTATCAENDLAIFNANKELIQASEQEAIREGANILFSMPVEEEDSIMEGANLLFSIPTLIPNSIVNNDIMDTQESQESVEAEEDLSDNLAQLILEIKTLNTYVECVLPFKYILQLNSEKAVAKANAINERLNKSLEKFKPLMEKNVLTRYPAECLDYLNFVCGIIRMITKRADDFFDKADATENQSQKTQLLIVQEAFNTIRFEQSNVFILAINNSFLSISSMSKTNKDNFTLLLLRFKYYSMTSTPTSIEQLHKTLEDTKQLLNDLMLLDPDSKASSQKFKVQLFQLKKFITPRLIAHHNAVACWNYVAHSLSQIEVDAYALSLELKNKAFTAQELAVIVTAIDYLKRSSDLYHQTATPDEAEYCLDAATTLQSVLDFKKAQVERIAASQHQVRPASAPVRMVSATSFFQPAQTHSQAPMLPMMDAFFQPISESDVVPILPPIDYAKFTFS